MNDEMRLARLDLGEGWIDLGYGEPVIIQELLHKHMNNLMLPHADALLQSQYQPPQGMKTLVDFLETKYKAKVVVTNGAKQGIAAVMYALKKMGHTNCMMHRPYWTSTPNLISDQGLEVVYIDESSATSDALFITSPNNPDGKELTQQQLIDLTKDAKLENVKLIHDAAYYTPIYTQETPVVPVGDVSIYSFAKMWGLSGLRVGYVVVRDEAFLPLIMEFVEKSCSGVSTASQQIALAVECYFYNNPGALCAFETECRNAIIASRAEIEHVDPQIIKLEKPTSNSMFAWGKAGPKLDMQKAKVNMIDGSIFGRPGYVRLNLGVHSDLIKNAVQRLNESINEQGAQ